MNKGRKMRTQLFKVLIGILLISSSQALAMTALEQKIESFNAQYTDQEEHEYSHLSDEEFQQLIDIRESGGDVFNQLIPQISETTESTKNILEVDAVQPISGIKSKNDLQKDVVARTQDGNWGVHFVYLGSNGTRADLSSLRINEKLRPASTMKIITSYLAFSLNSYPLLKMGTMLKSSDNGMADESLRSTITQKYVGYAIPNGDYAHSLIGYKMRDGRVNRTIDKNLARGVSLAMGTYETLKIEDGSKLHIVNGSGLQQSDKDTGIYINKVSPRFQTALLEKIIKSDDRYDVYKRLLAQPGQGGTLARRLAASNKLAPIYAKTGTLGNVKALMGVAETKKGKIVFSIIADGASNLRNAQTEIDNIVFQHIKYVTSNGL